MKFRPLLPGEHVEVEVIEDLDVAADQLLLRLVLFGRAARRAASGKAESRVKMTVGMVLELVAM